MPDLGAVPLVLDEREPVRCWIRSLETYLLQYLDEIQSIYGEGFAGDVDPKDLARLKELEKYEASEGLEPDEADELAEIRSRLADATDYVEKFAVAIKDRLERKGRLIREAEEFLAIRRLVDVIRERVFVPGLIGYQLRGARSKAYFAFYSARLLDASEMSRLQDEALTIVSDELVEPFEKLPLALEESDKIVSGGLLWLEKQKGNWVRGEYRDHIEKLAWATALKETGAVRYTLVRKGEPPIGYVRAFDPFPCDALTPGEVLQLAKELEAAIEAAPENAEAEQVLLDAVLSRPPFRRWFEEQLQDIPA